MRPPFVVYILVLASGVIHSAIYFPHLPETMASHFGGDGLPNGWSSKTAFFQLETFIQLVLFAAFIGLPWFLRIIRAESFSIPNRQYWLSPERRAATINLLRSRLCWFAVVNLLFLIFVNQLVFTANLTPGAKLDSFCFVIALVVFFGFVIIWISSLLLRFRNVGA